MFGTYGAALTRAIDPSPVCTHIDMLPRRGGEGGIFFPLPRVTRIHVSPDSLWRATLIKRLRDETGSSDGLPSRCSFAARAYAYDAQLLRRVKLSDF